MSNNVSIPYRYYKNTAKKLISTLLDTVSIPYRYYKNELRAVVRECKKKSFNSL